MRDQVSFWVPLLSRPKKKSEKKVVNGGCAAADRNRKPQLQQSNEKTKRSSRAGPSQAELSWAEPGPAAAGRVKSTVF